MLLIYWLSASLIISYNLHSWFLEFFKWLLIVFKLSTAVIEFLLSVMLFYSNASCARLQMNLSRGELRQSGECSSFLLSFSIQIQLWLVYHIFMHRCVIEPSWLIWTLKMPSDFRVEFSYVIFALCYYYWVIVICLNGVTFAGHNLYHFLICLPVCNVERESTSGTILDDTFLMKMHSFCCKVLIWSWCRCLMFKTNIKKTLGVMCCF